ncbi:MAG: hypothetical protein HWQ35_32465 [Nostoc sp. NMS1]|uniref:hypothetical protein n=1 Tax=unclassified Nostoc TaxID=2593658 RepID=UPI0025F8166B|nr:MULTISPECIES: hypothetical protein [unclassified Nostoc]MBN3911087.1 hypothetical protein [Nostoc sp. NMS1]MBN3990044.1 hypothetical protein [Nostoc sp. NMS2]
MTEEINKSYVQRYIAKAKDADNEHLKNDCLYRAGTQMEVIEVNSDGQLSLEQQQRVLDAASKLLGGQ